MLSSDTIAQNPKTFLQRNPTVAFFLLSFVVSWAGALLVALPALFHGREVSKTTGTVMFPAMLLGPSVAAIGMTFWLEGKAGMKCLFCRMREARVGSWWAFLAVPPLLVLSVLAVLARIVSPAFTPNHFYLGILFGIPAGFFEEIGWTGFAFPQMQSRFGFLKAAIVLGTLWGIWHLPVITYLGAATPHGSYWLPFFLAFTLAMTAMRVLISWLYLKTSSVLLAQLMHVSSTGALVVFSPSVTPGQEVMWYAIYGSALWMLAAILAASGQFGKAASIPAVEIAK